ncbi:Centrosomal protein B [Merluccius polli]|uniref:Centrosomal protein B n=1 Tax=Merluccius polli TaxID=89951 RepID=A0AA47M283_MERPO|nr:Centrosomal protein B [Merluccius polli]
MSVTSWFLVSSSGTRHRLPREMIFVGRDDCELMLQSRSVDKQHAVINYDPKTDEHMVKDLGSLNGTFVNDLRIPDQTYITLKLSDSQHKVPEEALKHEKYTSQLQLGLKALEARKKEKPPPRTATDKHTDSNISNGKLQDRLERKAYSATAGTDSPISKPTPLYGQPSWWGEDEDPDNKQGNGGGKQLDQESTVRDLSREGINGSLSENAGKAMYSYRREPSYFEIPTREFQQCAANTPQEEAKKEGDGVVQEVPTKDIPDPAAAPAPCAPSTPTPPVVQSHASFTIEFDECTPGKMKIKDHITKFSLRQQRKFPPKEAAAAPSEVISVESKVADWLVQSSMMRRRSHAEDVYNTKSDQSAERTTKGHQREDGTHSDSDKTSGIVNDLIQPQVSIGSPICQPPQKGCPPQRSSSDRVTPPDPDDPLISGGSKSPPTLGKSDPRHQPFLSDHLRKKESSQSLVSNASQADDSAQPENARKAPVAGGERQVSSLASSTPVSQRYTIPLKDPDAPAPGPLRAGSLRREKTEDRISTSFSSRSSSSISDRPFSSVGRRSKLAQDYTANVLKQAKGTTAADHWEKALSGSAHASPPRTAGSPDSPPRSPASIPSPPAAHLVKTSSPIHEPIPLKAPLMPRASQGAEDTPAPRGVPRPDEDDNLSDAGTYTIEAEALDKEVEEARNMIDQVFGVLESPEQSHHQTEADTPAAYRPDSIECTEQRRQSSSEVLRPAPEQGEGLVKRAPVSQGAPKWMSCWASLADSYTESDPSPGLRIIPSQMEQPGGGGVTILHNTTLSNESDGSRPRRVLPKVPLSDKSDAQTPGSQVCRYDLQSTFEVAETSSLSVELPGSALDPQRHSTTRDDLDPDSLSDASRSDGGSVVETRRTPPVLDAAERSDAEDAARLPAAKSTSFYVGSEEERGGSHPGTPKTERKPSPKLFSTATLTKQRGAHDAGKLKPTVSAPLLNQRRSPSPSSPESSRYSSSLIRQESFTKDRPSNARLPNISSKPASREPEPEDESPGAVNQDTHSYLKDTEDVLAALEAKLQAFQPPVAKPPSAMDSLSGESDIDTSSTVSHHSNKLNSLSTLNTVPTNGIHRERSSASIASLDSNRQSSASEHLPERRYSRGADGHSRTERGPVGLRHSTGKRGSMDLSDDAQGSSLPYSDQEYSSHHTRGKYAVPLKKDDAKPSKAAQGLSRSSSLSAPRATRASMLRRARLGDASDNESAETDRLAQDAASKQHQEAKKLTRLDMLAMPRKRTSSFNTPSDTEASSVPPVSSRTTGFSNRSTESSSSSARKASVPGPKPVPQKGALTKTPITRGRSSSAKYTSSTASSRRRQKGCDYASTSEDECDFKEPSTAKHAHKRSQPSPARNSSVTRGRSRPPPQPLVALRPKKSGQDSEEESHDGEAFHNWSNHSAEIARLSQDLAKDLAILAREIHDVAGDAEPQSSAAEAQVPASTVTAHEELVQHIPEAGLNYQRIPPSPAAPKDLDQNTRDPTTGDHEPNPRNRPRNREEVIVDNLMLNPVTQISLAIRENTDQLAGKLKVLFQDRMHLWEEVEAKINCDYDVPIVKTSNKEITSILNELRRVHRQLEVINTVMEPGRKPEQNKPSSTTTTAAVRSTRPNTKDWRTTHSVSRRGGGHRPGENIRTAAVTPEDTRDGYIV